MDEIELQVVFAKNRVHKGELEQFYRKIKNLNRLIEAYNTLDKHDQKPLLYEIFFYWQFIQSRFNAAFKSSLGLNYELVAKIFENQMRGEFERHHISTSYFNVVYNQWLQDNQELYRRRKYANELEKFLSGDKKAIRKILGRRTWLVGFIKTWKRQTAQKVLQYSRCSEHDIESRHLMLVELIKTLKNAVIEENISTNQKNRIRHLVMAMCFKAQELYEELQLSGLIGSPVSALEFPLDIFKAMKPASFTKLARMLIQKDVQTLPRLFVASEGSFFSSWRNLLNRYEFHLASETHSVISFLISNKTFPEEKYCLKVIDRNGNSYETEALLRESFLSNYMVPNIFRRQIEVPQEDAGHLYSEIVVQPEICSLKDKYQRDATLKNFHTALVVFAQMSLILSDFTKRDYLFLDMKNDKWGMQKDKLWIIDPTSIVQGYQGLYEFPKKSCYIPHVSLSSSEIVAPEVGNHKSVAIGPVHVYQLAMNLRIFLSQTLSIRTLDEIEDRAVLNGPEIQNVLVDLWHLTNEMLSENPKNRPEIAEVVRYLQQLNESHLPSCLATGEMSSASSECSMLPETPAFSELDTNSSYDSLDEVPPQIIPTTTNRPFFPLRLPSHDCSFNVDSPPTEASYRADVMRSATIPYRSVRIVMPPGQVEQCDDPEAEQTASPEEEKESEAAIIDKLLKSF